MTVTDVGSRHRRTPTRRRPRRANARRLLLGGLAVVVVALAAVGVWMARDAVRARDELVQASDLVGALKGELAAGDTAAARTTMTALQQHARQAHADLDGPQWSVASRVPFLGPNVAAARTVAAVVDELSTGALPGLVATTAALDEITGPEGVDLRPVLAAGPAITAADARVAAAQQRLTTIDPADLDSRIAAPVERLRAALADVRGTTAAAATAMTVLPGLLGADGPRRYLLLVQNNAEVRATGGLLGFVATLDADEGKVELTGSRAGSSMPVLERAPIPLTPEEKEVFGPQLGQYFGDANFTPDFPRTAQIVTAMWQRETGVAVDGVFSIDPVALAAVLRATGPVDLPGGRQLDADNAVRLLLNDVYLRIADPVKQDRFFAAAATAIFRAITSGQGDTLGAVHALAEATGQGRVYAWSAHESEQTVLARTALSGHLVGSAGDAPVVGVYLNDGSGAKMSYYLDTSVTVAQRCTADGQRLTTTVTMHSNAPADAAKLPFYVTGGGNYVPVGHTYTTVAVFSPTGGTVVSVSDPEAFTVAPYEDMKVALGTVDLAPGETKTFSVELAAPQSAVPEVRLTPGVRTMPATVTGAGCGTAR